MKIKLLKKLRKVYQLHERNGLFKVFENREYLGGVFNQTLWLDKEQALETRRQWILEEANRYLKPKRYEKV